MKPPSLPPHLARVGLCAVCAHSRHLETRKGIEYWSCERFRTDPRFVQYPPLPMWRCSGFEERETSSLP